MLPSRRTASLLYGSNMLQANGVELVFHPEGRPRYGGKAVGNSSVWFDGTVEPSSAGIFRVWSTKFESGRILLRIESYDLVRAVDMSDRVVECFTRLFAASLHGDRATSCNRAIRPPIDSSTIRRDRSDSHHRASVVSAQI